MTKKFGIICPPIAGHLNPMCTLGRALSRRGHEVTVFGIPAIAERIKRDGLIFCGLGPEEGDLAATVQRMGQLSGISSLRFAVQGACRLAELVCTYGPDAIEGARIDLLLVDQNEPAGGTVAERLGIPFVSVCPSLPLNREPTIPPPFVAWGYSPDWRAQLRNRAGYAVSDILIAPINKTLNRFRAKWKLTSLEAPDDSFSKIAQLCQLSREFDFPRRRLPKGFHYLGPFIDEVSEWQTEFPFGRLDGRPLIYASMGTLQSGESEHFHRIAEACSPLGVQLVIATGHSATGPRAFAGDPIVVNYAPQMRLLARASLTITHAGLNTVMQSLSLGVPMVAVPMTHDQPAIAARLVRTGAGVVIAPQTATSGRLRDAVKLVLNGREFRAAARRLKESIEQAGGVERAADLTEEYAQCISRS